ncbi:hydantoinase B/oxoprolinase family protein [Modestobacter versicolor]|uniref:hydantoinase B/oxoprolinase family protein n=1 Tax=Modestobacter versicolor TaxID=429133 RepID=UPI0034DE4CDF
MTDTAAGTAAELDGGTVEVVRNHLVSVAEQMRRTLVRTAFNPVIYEVLDFGISVYDVHRRLMAEAAGITSFIGANDYALPKLLEHVPAERIGPGDVLLLNYPYWNSAHAYDAMLMMPVFAPASARTEPSAYLAVRAHWMDLGAKDPAYVLDSTDVHQEGLLFPGTRIVKGGVVDEEVVDLIRFNSRLPEQTIGDFHAQYAALRVGERELTAVWERFGLDVVEACVQRVMEHGEQAARRAVAALPDGVWTAEDWLDDDGITEEPLLMKVTVTIDGDQMTVDYNGGSGEVLGPVNVPFGSTESMAKTAFKAITTPDEPSNAGHYACLTVLADPGTLFHATYPSATFTLWTTTVAFELFHKAVAPALRELSASSGSDEPGFMALGRDSRTGRDFVISNNEGVGWGGSAAHDGANAQMNPSQSVVRNTPIEVLELRSTLFHERLELIEDSAGAGTHRGGVGLERRIRWLEDGEMLSMKKKTTTNPWALAGGHEPMTNRMTVFPGTPEERDVRMRRVSMRTGEVFVNRSAGGGGWGDPLSRDPLAVVDDVLDGYVSPAQARDVYGVLVAEDGGWSPTPARSAATPTPTEPPVTTP